MYLYSLLEREEELVLLLTQSQPIVQSSLFPILQKQHLFQEYKNEPLLYIKGENTVLIPVENTFFHILIMNT